MEINYTLCNVRVVQIENQISHVLNNAVLLNTGNTFLQTNVFVEIDFNRTIERAISDKTKYIKIQF